MSSTNTSTSTQALKLNFVEEVIEGGHKSWWAPLPVEPWQFPLHVTVRACNGPAYVVIRAYFDAKSGKLTPGRRGVVLNKNQWAVLCENGDTIVQRMTQFWEGGLPVPGETHVCSIDGVDVRVVGFGEAVRIKNDSMKDEDGTTTLAGLSLSMWKFRSLMDSHHSIDEKITQCEQEQAPSSSSDAPSTIAGTRLGLCDPCWRALRCAVCARYPCHCA